MISSRAIRYGWACLLAVVFGMVGCGSGGSGAPQQAGIAPYILKQPSDQSVPMGLSGSFAVSVVGTGVTYQWNRNGGPISGATESTYTTPATVFADTGSIFTVTVTNQFGVATTSPVTLTVTARAPKSGDLRFKQIDSESTVGGYARAVIMAPYFVDCTGSGEYGFGGVVGYGFHLTNAECIWQYDNFSQPSGAERLSVEYAAHPATAFNYWFSLGSTDAPAGTDPGSVIIGMGYQKDMLSYAYMHAAHSSGFDATFTTVDAAGFAGAVAQDGLHGRVVTGFYINENKITYVSYGWTGDTSQYETKVLTGTQDQAIDMAKTLASQGYLLTANSSTQAADGTGVVFVGTRVLGDAMPRPLLTGDQMAGTVDAVTNGGYAVVAVISKFSGYTLVSRTYIGER